MSRSVRLLETFRTGKVGLGLFYGYLVAILIVGVILFHGGQINDQQNDKIATQTHRQCIAIAGAVSYWRNAREVVQLRLSDYTQSPTERKADTKLLAALNKVILGGSSLSCEVVK
jgi:hypothetical protein